MIESKRENRPWGHFLEFTRNQPSTVKLIIVDPGQRLSLQKHKNRDEFWHIVSGEGEIIIGDQKLPVIAEQDFFIPREAVHRVAAGEKPLVILEIAIGEAEENDIIRIEDDYNRIS